MSRGVGRDGGWKEKNRGGPARCWPLGIPAITGWHLPRLPYTFSGRCACMRAIALFCTMNWTNFRGSSVLLRMPYVSSN